jgi:hypothetical protein
VHGLGDRGPVALTNKTSEHASGCTAVDGNERRLDGVVQMPKVAGVLPRHVLFDELKQMRWDARARCNEQSSQDREKTTSCLIGIRPLGLAGQHHGAFQGHSDVICIELHSL